MKNSLRYVVDKNGKRTDVLVPIDVWENINRKLSKLLNKVEVLTGIRSGLLEVRNTKKTGKKLPTLKVRKFIS